jgi:hypothetical protein
MTLVIKKSAGGGIHIDEGKYTAVVESINVGKGQEGNEYLTWAFKVAGATIDDEPFKGDARVVGFCNALLTPKSKLYKWAQGAGIDVTNEDEEEVDLQEAIGSTVRISVEDYETKDGATVSRVVKISQLKKKGKKVKEEEDDDEEAPKKSKKAPKEEKKAKKKAKPVEDDDEDASDDDDEEEEAPKKSKKAPKEEKKAKKKAKPADDDDEEEDDDLYSFDDDADEDDDD